MTEEEAIKTLLGRAIERISELEAEVAELKRCRAISEEISDKMNRYRMEQNHAYIDLAAEKQRLEVELSHAKEVIEDLKRKIPKWTHIRDATPTLSPYFKDIICLVYNETEKPYRAYAVAGLTQLGFISQGEEVGCTHWMPLPSPP